MTLSDDEDESLAQFLESEVLSEVSESEEEKKLKEVEEPKQKKLRTEKCSTSGSANNVNNNIIETCNEIDTCLHPRRIETGMLSKIPPELFPHILKFLSSEDLISCSLVCRFLNYAASDECLWRRLYCMRWGLLPATENLRVCAWKKLYVQRDEEDMAELVRNCPTEFKEYYMQMQAAKRSQAPLPSQVKDDRVILDKTVSDQVSIWKSSRGLTDNLVTGHACSGEICTYHHIGNVFVCEKTGYVHVCDDTCREVDVDPNDGLLVCKISGHCFDCMMSPDETEADSEQQGGVTDEAEPFMGSGRFARAYTLGYNCEDEKELEYALRCDKPDQTDRDIRGYGATRYGAPPGAYPPAPGAYPPGVPPHGYPRAPAGYPPGAAPSCHPGQEPAGYPPMGYPGPSVPPGAIISAAAYGAYGHHGKHRKFKHGKHKEHGKFKHGKFKKHGQHGKSKHGKYGKFKKHK